MGEPNIDPDDLVWFDGWAVPRGCVPALRVLDDQGMWLVPAKDQRAMLAELHALRDRLAAIDAAVAAAGGAERVRTAGLCLAEMAEGTFGHDAAVILRAVVGDAPAPAERCPTCGSEDPKVCGDGRGGRSGHRHGSNPNCCPHPFHATAPAPMKENDHAE